MGKLAPFIFLSLLLWSSCVAQDNKLPSGFSLKADLAGWTLVPLAIEPYYGRISVEGEFQIRKLKRWTASLDLEFAYYEEQFERFFGSLWLGAWSYQRHCSMHLGPRFYAYEISPGHPRNGFFVEPQLKIAYDWAEISPDHTTIFGENVEEWGIDWRFRLGLQGFFSRRWGFSLSGDLHQRKLLASGGKRVEILPEVNLILSLAKKDIATTSSKL